MIFYTFQLVQRPVADTSQKRYHFSTVLHQLYNDLIRVAFVGHVDKLE